MGDLPAFAELAHHAGFRAIGLLPLQRLHGGETSPYGADSAFALDPVYLTLAALPELQGDASLEKLDAALAAEVQALAGRDRVDYQAVRAVKERVLRLAFARFESDHLAVDSERAQAFARFRAETHWVRDVALFSRIRELEQGHSWRHWPEPLRDRHPEALAEVEAREEAALRYHVWLQFALVEQWRQVRAKLDALGIGLYGDLPFAPGGDSVDVWVRPGCFRHDFDLGVPPDAFSDVGQNWGLPPYDIEAMRETGFAFFRERLAWSCTLYDELRLDHVVGYFRQWLWTRTEHPEGHFSPWDEPQQQALGRELMAVFADAIGKATGGGQGAIVAEDLGVIPGFVRYTLTDLGIAGYKVIPWERGDDHRLRDPRQFPAASFATYSTHDTLPITQWVGEMSHEERRELLGLAGVRDDADLDTQLFGLFALLFSSGARRTYVLATELLGDTTRINLPGSMGDHNWTWRLPARADQLQTDPVYSARFARFRELLQQSGRLG